MADTEVAPTQVDKSESRQLFTAISNGQLHRLRSLLAQIHDLNIRDTRSLQTPLIHAIRTTPDDVRTHVIRLLLHHGCDVNAQDDVGRTALMYACMAVECVDSVRLLSKRRHCDANIQDKDGNTAVFHCIEFGNLNALTILVRNFSLKADLVNKTGLSAVDLALKLGRFDCCRVLLDADKADMGSLKHKLHFLLLLQDLSKGKGNCLKTSEMSFSTTTEVKHTICLTRNSSEPEQYSPGSRADTLSRSSSSHGQGHEPREVRQGSSAEICSRSFLGQGHELTMMGCSNGLSSRKLLSLPDMYHPSSQARPESNNSPCAIVGIWQCDSDSAMTQSRTISRRIITAASEDSETIHSMDGRQYRPVRRLLTPIKKRRIGVCSFMNNAVTDISLQTLLPNIPSGGHSHNTSTI